MNNKRFHKFVYLERIREDTKSKVIGDYGEVNSEKRADIYGRRERR